MRFVDESLDEIKKLTKNGGYISHTTVPAIRGVKHELTDKKIMALCCAMKPGFLDQHCTCPAKYKRIYFTDDTFLPTGHTEELCGRHVNNRPHGPSKSSVTTRYVRVGGQTNEYVDAAKAWLFVNRTRYSLKQREVGPYVEGDPLIAGTPRYDEMLATVSNVMIRKEEQRRQVAELRRREVRERVARVVAAERVAAERGAAAQAAARGPAQAAAALFVPPPVQRVLAPPARELSAADRARMAERARQERVEIPDPAAPPPPPPPPPPPSEPSYLPDPHPPMSESELRVCAVCMTDVGTVICSERRHVMCEECFADYAVIESNDAGFDGELRCCGFKPYGCKAQPFRQVAVIRALPESKATEFAAGCERSKERLVLEEYKHAESERQRREGASSEVERAHTHIVDHILTLRCPNERCGAAILDFTGCLAIVCNRCKSGICAKCFELCGSDAHKHLREGLCKIDPTKHYFADPEYIANVQSLYKTRKLKEYLGTLPERVVREVVTKYRDEIKEGGVNI